MYIIALNESNHVKCLCLEEACQQLVLRVWFCAHTFLPPKVPSAHCWDLCHDVYNIHSSGLSEAGT